VGGTVPGARNLPLPQLLEHLDELDRSRPTVVYCAGGYRSSAAASTLRAQGFTTVADMIGGYGAWVRATRDRDRAADRGEGADDTLNSLVER
jgi:rhodanese-related sulfurtransferase